jgi:hypothetical protein
MIHFLGSEVGRGHPFYGDGVRRALAAAGRDDLVGREADVFSVSRGTSRLAWRAVRAAYRIAGRGGGIAAVYHRMRGRVDYDVDSRLLRSLGRDLRRWAGDEGLVVVDHPAVAGALGGRRGVWYVHGEMVAPPESVVRRASGVLVPTDEVAGEFVRGGVPADRVRVTGICVENELVPGAGAAAAARRERLAGGGPLTLAFFSSGAEPPPHVATLAAAAEAGRGAGHDVRLFARRGGRLARAARGLLRGAPDATRAASIVEWESRTELDRLTAERLPAVDVVVSPPHERSNWAVALGIPFLLVGPDIGPFAPLNRRLLLRRGVAVELHSPEAAARLPETLAELTARGLLVRMAENGIGPPIDGFRVAVRTLIEASEAP